MTRKTLKIISGISLGILIPTSLSTITSCSSNKNNDIFNYDYSWEDVDCLENQMINEVEIKAKNNYEFDSSLQAIYSNEDVYVLEQAQEYQSNLDLDLIKWKSQKGRTSTDIYNLLDERASNDSLSTLNWKFINDTSKNILSTFNSAIDSQFSDLSALERAEFKNQLNSKYNDLMYKAQRKNYGKNDTFGYIRSELNTYIDSLIAKEASKLRAKNTLHDFLLSGEFSINPILLSQPKDNSDIVVSLHNWELASNSEKKQIENSLFPLLATYKKLPVNSETLLNKEQNKNFLLSLSIDSLEWTDPFDASLTITIHVLDSNLNEELASQQLKDIKIEDNIEGIKVAANQIINYVTFDLKSNPASYSAFKNSVLNGDSSQQTNVFVTQDIINQIINFDISNQVGTQEKLSIYKLQSNSEFNVGAYVSFNDNQTDDFGGFVTVTPCLYVDSKNIQYDTPYIILTDTATNLKSSNTFGLPKDPLEEEQEIYIDERSVMSYYQCLSDICDQYDYFSNEENKQECQKTLTDVKSTIKYGAITYATIATSSVASLIADVVAQSYGFFAVDLSMFLVFDGLSGYADFSMLLPMKNSIQDQLNQFDAVRSSDDYKAIQKLVVEKNLHQYTKDIFNSIKDFIVQDPSYDSVCNIKEPKDLLSNYSQQNISFKELVKKTDQKIKEVFSSAFSIFGEVVTSFTNQLSSIVETIGTFKSLPDRWECLETNLCKSFQTGMPNINKVYSGNSMYHNQKINLDYDFMIQNLLGVGCTKINPKTDTFLTPDDFLKKQFDRIYEISSKYSTLKVNKQEFYTEMGVNLQHYHCNFDYMVDSPYNFIDKLYTLEKPYDISYSEFSNIMNAFHKEQAAYFPERIDKVVKAACAQFNIQPENFEKVLREFAPFKKTWIEEVIYIRNSNLLKIFSDPKKTKAFITICLQAADFSFYDNWSRTKLRVFSTRPESLRYKILEKKFDAAHIDFNTSSPNFLSDNIWSHPNFKDIKLAGQKLYAQKVSVVSPSYSTTLDKKYFAKSKFLGSYTSYKMTEEEDQICLEVANALNAYKKNDDIDAFSDSINSIGDNHNDVFKKSPKTYPTSKYNSYVPYEQEEFFNLKKVRTKLVTFSTVILSVGILGSIIGSALQTTLKNKISNIVEKM